LEGLADHHLTVPLHAHTHEDEIWYVLEGQITFYLGDEPDSLRDGALVRHRDAR
jgi:uncharacterized cupin superfamily protein